MAIIAPLTPDETARLEALAAYDVLDTPHEPVFQAITALAAAITGSPIALISLVDKDRQWFKANWGLDVRETPRDIAFCSHAIHQSELFEVSDAFTDKRFFDNPLVQGDLNIRFYAGHPLETDSGYKLGTLCVLDHQPKVLNDSQRQSLSELAVVVMRLFEAHRKTREIEQELSNRVKQIRTITDSLPAHITYVDRDQRYRFCNAKVLNTFDSSRPIIGQTMQSVLGDQLYHRVKSHVERALSGATVQFDGEAVVGNRRIFYHANYIPDRADNGEIRGFHEMTFDLTEQKLIEFKLLASERRLNLIADNLPAVICYIDREHIYRYNNATHARWLARPLSEITGRSLREISGDAIYNLLLPKLVSAFSGNRVEFEVDVENLGELRHIKGHAVPDFDEGNSVVGIYVMMQDATGLKHAQAALVRLARFDSLTTLANRASLYEILNAALARRSRSGNTLAVLYLDLDKLKAINDRFGHAGGDTVLREFARRLKISIRQTDTAARIAGDEFVVVLEGLHSPDDADAIARTILRNTEGPILIGDQPLHITTSIGIAFGDVTDDAESLLRHADKALYQAKAAGRNVFKRAPQH